MTRTRADISKIKMRMLELYSIDLRISDAEVCRVCKINPHTAAKYRKQLFELLDGIWAKVSEKEKEVEEETVGIWKKLSKILG